MTDRRRAFALGVLTKRAESLQGKGGGQGNSRHRALLGAAQICGQMVASGVLEESEVRAALGAAAEAAMGNGRRREIRRTLSDGLARGRAAGPFDFHAAGVREEPQRSERTFYDRGRSTPRRAPSPALRAAPPVPSAAEEAEKAKRAKDGADLALLQRAIAQALAGAPPAPPAPSPPCPPTAPEPAPVVLPPAAEHPPAHAPPAPSGRTGGPCDPLPLPSDVVPPASGLPWWVGEAITVLVDGVEATFLDHRPGPWLGDPCGVLVRLPSTRECWLPSREITAVRPSGEDRWMAAS